MILRIAKANKSGGEAGKKEAKTLTEMLKIFKKLGAKKDAIAAEKNARKLSGPTATFLKQGSKLTLPVIYDEIMKIAAKNQEGKNWQKPMPIFPNSMDFDHDYITFDGRGDNLWVCLMRLATMMVSKKPPTSSPSRINFDAGTNAKSERWRMVGGKFTPYTARLKKKPVGMQVRTANGEVIETDAIPSDQTTFFLWQFSEAPYDYMLQPSEPIVTYHYFGGSKVFDKNNLPEILEFSVDMEGTGAYFINPDLMKVSKMANTKTGAGVDFKRISKQEADKSKREAAGSNTKGSTKEISKPADEKKKGSSATVKGGIVVLVS